MGRSSRSRTRPSSLVSACVSRIGRSSSPSLSSVTWTPAAGRPPSVSSTWVEMVGRASLGADPSAGVPGASSGTYPPVMGELRISVGDDLHFSARWEAEAPQTIEAIRRMLPIDSKLIHCRWSGESTWIPYGDFRPGIDYENHTSHPAPGMLALYPGGISECEIFFPYGACATASKVGQLAANHFATIEPRARRREREWRRRRRVRLRRRWEWSRRRWWRREWGRRLG